jgi:alcohol dehydrogenase (cytochrome c)
LQPASSASEIRDCDGTVAAFDDTTFEEVWKFNVGFGITTPPMSFAANGKQYVAIATGASISSRARLINTPELKDIRNVTMLYVFGL